MHPKHLGFSWASTRLGSTRHSTVKDPESVMVWRALSGIRVRAGMFFLPPQITMNVNRYLTVLNDRPTKQKSIGSAVQQSAQTRGRCVFFRKDENHIVK